jgi:hypothetical protein
MAGPTDRQERVLTASSALRELGDEGRTAISVTIDMRDAETSRRWFR